MVAGEQFVVLWPENLPLDSGAPLLCARITTHSPLKQFGLRQVHFVKDSMFFLYCLVDDVRDSIFFPLLCSETDLMWYLSPPLILPYCVILSSA